MEFDYTQDVDWCCEVCFENWGAPPQVNPRICPKCGSRRTYWLDRSEPEDMDDGTQHKFVADDVNEMYCRECGCSESDHRL